MLGPRVRASQTRGLFCLYGAEAGEVHEAQRRRLALSFLWVRELCFRYYYGRNSAEKVTAFRYGSLAVNTRILPRPSGACYQ